MQVSAEPVCILVLPCVLISLLKAGVGGEMEKVLFEKNGSADVT